MRLTIRKKLLLCSILPISVLGIIIVFMSLTFLRNSIINQVENSLRGTAAATLAAYDQNSGTYLVAENGDGLLANVTITSSDPSVVEIDNKGHYYGNKEGKAIVTISAGDCSKSIEFIVMSYEDYNDYLMDR